MIDFDVATRDPANPTRYLPLYDSGDHLHPNDAGISGDGGCDRPRAIQGRTGLQVNGGPVSLHVNWFEELKQKVPTGKKQ